jgi:hypothetical protein
VDELRELKSSLEKETFSKSDSLNHISSSLKTLMIDCESSAPH